LETVGSRDPSRSRQRGALERIAVALAVATLALGCGQRPKSVPELPHVRVDMSRSQLGTDGGTAGAEPYTVRPGVALVVDLRGFESEKAMYPGLQPDAIHLILGEDRQYFLPIGALTEVTLDAGTLVPMGTSAAFRGLQLGDEGILALGQQRIDEGANQLSFKVQWVALLRVQEPVC
jgi:hypothetical protein